MADIIFPSTLAFMWIVYIWESYLDYRQRKVIKETNDIPVELKDSLDKVTFEKARAYNLDKSHFGFFASLYSQLEGTIILLLNGFPLLWAASGALNIMIGYDESHEIKQSMLFIMLCMVISTITSLPWSLYSTFVIEERHGFNKQTLGFYFKDLVKKMFVSLAIAIPVTAALLWIIKWGGEYFFVYAWLFSFGVSLFMIAVYHDYIAPIFDTFIPLPNGNLRQLIEDLARRIQFPLSKIFIIEGSKRSSHSNAYFFGFYKKKVIVLFDTLLPVSPFASEGSENKEKSEEVKNTEKTDDPKEVTEDTERAVDKQEVIEANKDSVSNEKDKSACTASENKDEVPVEAKGCSDEEILAILGHELGHWKLSHILKNLIISQVNLFMSFFVFGLLMNMKILYESFGFYDQQPTIIGLLIIFQFIFSPYNELVGFLMTILSRKFEFQADDFAKKLDFAPRLQSALIKLHKENLGFPASDPLYSSYHYSHPPLLERLRALKIKTE